MSGAGTLALSGGSTSIVNGAKLTQANWTVSGGSTTVTLNENLSYGGTFTQTYLSTLSLSTGDKLYLTGASKLGGTVSGLGTLALSGGSTSIVNGAKLTQANWTVSGGSTTVTLNEALTYAGTFSAGAGTDFR